MLQTRLFDICDRLQVQKVQIAHLKENVIHSVTEHGWEDDVRR